MRLLIGKIFLWFVGTSLLSGAAFLGTLTFGASPRSAQGFLPFYLWALLGTALLGYLVAINLVRPLQRLTYTVEQFGRGDLTARTGSQRRDEIGGLARAFDRMAERIETLLTAERRLLQDVSHELRSPLARLRFAVELARTDHDRDEALTHIAKDVERLANLVDELLQLTRAEGDPSTQNLHLIRLDDLLRSLVDDGSLEAEARHRRLQLRIEGSALILGDRELLRRAIENVIRNAIHYSPEQTTIEVVMTKTSELVTITVRDHGPGIPDLSLPEIFKPFFRVDGDRARASGGVGLGLSIAERAISLHQGRIKASNAHPGLVVTIELPYAMDESSQA